MNNEKLIAYCQSHNACDEAVAWLEETGYDLKTAWNNCPRGDWMGWLITTVGIDKRTRVLCAAMCANEVRHLMKGSRSINAIDVALRYGRGEANEEELSDADVSAATVSAAAAAAGSVSAAYAYAAAAGSGSAAYAYASAATGSVSVYAAAAYAAAASAATGSVSAAAGYATTAYAADASAVSAEYAAYAAYAAARKEMQSKTAKIFKENIDFDCIKNALS